jgi:hypothetical protein
MWGGDDSELMNGRKAYVTNDVTSHRILTSGCYTYIYIIISTMHFDVATLRHRSCQIGLQAFRLQSVLLRPVSNSQSTKKNVRFEVFTSVTMKNAVFWDVTADVGSSLADFSTLNMEAIRSFETSVHRRSTRRHIPEDGILQRRK